MLSAKVNDPFDSAIATFYNLFQFQGWHSCTIHYYARRHYLIVIVSSFIFLVFDEAFENNIQPIQHLFIQILRNNTCRWLSRPGRISLNLWHVMRPEFILLRNLLCSAVDNNIWSKYLKFLLLLMFLVSVLGHLLHQFEHKRSDVKSMTIIKFLSLCFNTLFEGQAFSRISFFYAIFVINRVIIF